ncbi:hypothetical protein AB5I41_01505 [Sphingomonas sp. MMS24-JH45]
MVQQSSPSIPVLYTRDLVLTTNANGTTVPKDEYVRSRLTIPTSPRSGAVARSPDRGHCRRQHAGCRAVRSGRGG